MSVRQAQSSICADCAMGGGGASWDGKKTCDSRVGWYFRRCARGRCPGGSLKIDARYGTMHMLVSGNIILLDDIHIHDPPNCYCWTLCLLISAQLLHHHHLAAEALVLCAVHHYMYPRLSPTCQSTCQSQYGYLVSLSSLCQRESGISSIASHRIAAHRTRPPSWAPGALKLNPNSPASAAACHPSIIIPSPIASFPTPHRC